MTALPAASPPEATTAPASWSDQTAFIQPRQLAFWLYLLVLVPGLDFVVKDHAQLLQASATIWAVSVGLLALYVAPVLLIVNAVDLFEREPRSLLAAAFIWGAAAAPFLAVAAAPHITAILSKLAPQLVFAWNAAIEAPLAEEFSKVVGVALIALIARHEFDDPLDGFVYGVVVGLGFTVSENVHYLVGGVLNPTISDEAALGSAIINRTLVLGPYGHVVWTGLTGYAVGFLVTRTDLERIRRIRLAAAIGALGVAAHFFWNSPILADLFPARMDLPMQLLYYGVRGLPVLVLLAILVRMSIRRERGWFRGALEPEAAAGVVSADELEALGGLRSRRAARRAIARRKGAGAAQLLARLQHAEIELGVALAGSRGVSTPRADQARDRVRALRAELAAIPDVGTPVQPVPVTGTKAPPVPAPQPAPQPAPGAVRVPANGMASWATPDGRTTPTPLAGGLALEIVQQIGDWAQVRASNGWTGWVDARRLVRDGQPAAGQ